LLNAGQTTVKLTDFSLAQRMEEVRLRSSLVGTSGFIPPEARRAEYVDDFTLDVYALGKTLRDFLLRVLPSRLWSRVGGQTTAEKSALLSLCRIVERAIRERPDRRYPDAQEVLADFNRRVGG
jgi:serine/threonine protein kinase